jgi:hypothetical protein
MVLFRSIGATIDLPLGWSARSATQRDLVIYPDADEGWSDPNELARSIIVSRTPTDRPPGRFVRLLMRRRVPQGHPSVLPPLRIDGLRALGLDYTDGVRSIATWFVSVEAGHVHEVTCMAYHAETGAPLMDCVATGRAFAARIRWLAPIKV